MNRSAAKFLKAKDRINLWNIAVGDEVKVISGPYKGKVGQVQECIKDKNKIIVSGINIVKKTLPLFLAQKSGLEGQRFEYAAPIHYSNVRLMGELPSATNPTGPKRRVEIKRVFRGKTFYNKDKKLLTWRRWVPGENVFLPWPRNDHSKPDGPMDTKAADVANNTYVESLHTSPMPLDVEDQLRNKYSRFRYLKTRESNVTDEVLDVADVEGLEPGIDTTDDVDIAQTKPRRVKRGDTFAGLDAKTIEILAQAMSSTRIQGPKDPEAS